MMRADQFITEKRNKKGIIKKLKNASKRKFRSRLPAAPIAKTNLEKDKQQNPQNPQNPQQQFQQPISPPPTANYKDIKADMDRQFYEKSMAKSIATTINTFTDPTLLQGVKAVLDQKLSSMSR